MEACKWKYIESSRRPEVDEVVSRSAEPLVGKYTLGANSTDAGKVEEDSTAAASDAVPQVAQTQVAPVPSIPQEPSTTTAVPVTVPPSPTQAKPASDTVETLPTYPRAILGIGAALIVLFALATIARRRKKAS